MYQTRDECLTSIQNMHQEERSKYNSLLSLWKCGETLHFAVDILRQSKKSSNEILQYGNDENLNFDKTNLFKAEATLPRRNLKTQQSPL